MSAAGPEGRVVVAVGGEVDISNADELHRRLVKVLEECGPHLIADLSGLSFIDSSGMLALTRALRHARRLGGTLQLAAPQRPVAKVLRVTGTWDLFGVFPSVEAARSG